jgi:hypothetical protein
MTPEIEKTPEIETTPGTVLWRFRRGPQGIVVKRPHRREVWGTAYIAQRCRLIPDRPDAGDESYPCKIADVSTGGFCVVCNAAETSPRLFRAGAEMTANGFASKSGGTRTAG